MKLNKVIITMLSLIACKSLFAVSIKFDTNQIDPSFYGAYYQDFYLETYKQTAKGKEPDGQVVTYTVPNTPKNFKAVSEDVDKKFKQFKKKFSKTGIQRLIFFTDLLTKDGKVTCFVDMDADRVTLDETITLPNNEFCAVNNMKALAKYNASTMLAQNIKSVVFN